MMGKLIVSEFVTVDGVMQAPGGPDEDRRGGFPHGGWQQAHPDEVVGDFVLKGIDECGGFLLGRRTYDIFAAYWPVQPAEDSFAARINALPKYVVSRTLKDPLSWNGSVLIRGNLVEEVRGVKRRHAKDILVIGSGDLVQTLMQHDDLIDEYRLMVYPLVLGSGLKLFRDGCPKTSLRLTAARTTKKGVEILTYRAGRDV